MQLLQATMHNRLGRIMVTCLVAITWMTVSSGLIFLNKWIMAVDKFEYPMFLAGLGMLFSGCASFTVCRVLKWIEVKKQLTWRFYISRIMPVGLFMALTLAFGNLVYLYLTVSFISILKAFTPVITMFCAFVAGLEVPHYKLVISVFIIAGGVATASYGAVDFNLLGIFIMFLSELTESIRLIMTQILLQGHKFNAIEGLMYTAPACVFWLSIGSLIFESSRMIEANAFAKMAARPMLYMAAAGMGFLVNGTAYLTIQLAGSLTVKVLGTVKNALVVWLGVLLWSDPVTRLQLWGYGASIIGFAMYNKHKMQQASSTSQVYHPASDGKVVLLQEPPLKHGTYNHDATTPRKSQKDESLLEPQQTERQAA